MTLSIVYVRFCQHVITIIIVDAKNVVEKSRMSNSDAKNAKTDEKRSRIPLYIR